MAYGEILKLIVFTVTVFTMTAPATVPPPQPAEPSVLLTFAVELSEAEFPVSVLVIEPVFAFAAAVRVLAPKLIGMFAPTLAVMELALPVTPVPAVALMIVLLPTAFATAAELAVEVPIFAPAFAVAALLVIPVTAALVVLPTNVVPMIELVEPITVVLACTVAALFDDALKVFDVATFPTTVLLPVEAWAGTEVSVPLLGLMPE